MAEECDTIDLKALRKECGCEIFINTTGHRFIRHCPMHAAAGVMLAALEGVAFWVLEDGSLCWCKHGDRGPDSEHHLEGCFAARAAVRAARGGAPVRDRAKEALDRIAALPREGEPLDDSGHHTLAPNYCQRSPQAAFGGLDDVILWAREARGGA